VVFSYIFSTELRRNFIIKDSNIVNPYLKEKLSRDKDCYHENRVISDVTQNKYKRSVVWNMDIIGHFLQSRTEDDKDRTVVIVRYTMS